MIIDCIADLHGYYPHLEGGDLLIVAGDLTARDHLAKEWLQFEKWAKDQNYREKIIIAGNHDNTLQSNGYDLIYKDWKHFGFTYLCDSGTEFEGLRIWGSPWSQKFPGMNPHCMAFTCDTDEELAEKWRKIPDNLDILVTHSPPYGIFDGISLNSRMEKCTGSISLRNHVMGRIKPKIHVFGHIHEHGGKVLDAVTTKFINSSHVNEHYQPVNKPVRIVL